MIAIGFHIPEDGPLGNDSSGSTLSIDCEQVPREGEEVQIEGTRFLYRVSAPPRWRIWTDGTASVEVWLTIASERSSPVLVE